MSSFNLKSQALTNRDASPSRLSDPIVARGMVQDTYGCERVPTTADIGSQIRLISVPSSARITDLQYLGQALGTSSLDIAAWFPTSVQAQSSVVAARLISSSAYGTALFNSDGVTAPTDGMPAVGTMTLPQREQALWARLGLGSDPNVDIDLGFTVRTTNSIAGYVGLRARFVR